MQSLVRFAWMESREPIRDPQEVVLRFFGGVEIRTPLLSRHFEIIAHTTATIGAAPLTSRSLTRLRQSFRNHLEELVEAAPLWPDAHQRRDPLAEIVPNN